MKNWEWDVKDTIRNNVENANKWETEVARNRKVYNYPKKAPKKSLIQKIITKLING